MNQTGMILEQYEAAGMSVALCLNEQIACAKQVQQRGIYALVKKKRNSCSCCLKAFFRLQSKNIAFLYTDIQALFQILLSCLDIRDMFHIQKLFQR